VIVTTNPNEADEKAERDEWVRVEKIEDALRDVLLALRPLDADETTRVLLAVAVLYDLPIVEVHVPATTAPPGPASGGAEVSGE